MDIQLIGPLPFPAALDGNHSTSNECGFVEFRLTIRKLGLITNISIKQKPDQGLIGSTDLQSGSAPIWVIGQDKPNQLLNTTDGTIRIPIVEPESFLLYNARACNSDQIFQKMEAVITYSDGRILTTTVANATTK